MTIFTEPITTPQFEPFGQLIAAPESFGRQSFATGLSHGDRAPVLSTTHTPPFRLPLTLDKMECHPHSSQSFLPLDVTRWLVVVSLSLEPTDIRAFVVGPGVGVTIARGVWHYQLTALDRSARFAVLMWKNGAADDDQFARIEPVQVQEATATLDGDCELPPPVRADL
ncbi:MAG: ureidoglycolate lyase [Acidimicrobiales bacterium]|jgi:ureidoglycolate lyase